MMLGPNSFQLSSGRSGKGEGEVSEYNCISSYA
jgi:hypothetical protein